MIIVSYTVPTFSGLGLNRRFWLRDEGTPNRRDWAERFPTREAAEKAAAEVRENLATLSLSARFHFEEVL